MPNDNTRRRRGKRKDKRYSPQPKMTDFFPSQKSDEKRGFANESSNAIPNTNNNDAVTVLYESKVNHEAKCDPVLEWTEEDVKQWLHRLPDGLGQYSQNFVEAGVTGKYLVNHLTVDILESMKIKKMHALHLYEEICELRRKGIHSIDDVRAYIQRHEHLLLPYATNNFKVENFTVKETHPFHEKVQNEAIPMGGYDCSQGHPNLLLWNLPQSTKQFKNDNPGVSWVLKVGQRILNGGRNHPLGVLFGVSGCGKSRTIFEVLSTRYGLYFEPYGSQQPGSPEMKPLESKIHMKAEYDKENLTSIATHLIHALVLTRLLLLFHCQRLACDASTTMQPRSWLFAQLRAPQLLTSNNLVLFTEVFEQLSKCHPEVVLDEVEDLLKKFVTDARFQKTKSNLYVFTDEAHVLLKSCERKFVSRTAGDKGRALFSHFFKTLSDLDHMNIFLAGTALRLSDSQELMKSCIGKDTKEEDLVFHKFYRYDTDNKIQEYLWKFMSPGRFLKDIRELFQGRPRFLACFVSHVLRHNATDKDEIIEESIHDAKTFLIGGKNIRDKRSLGYQLDQLDEQGRPTLVRVAGGRADVINLLEKLVVAYYLSNGPLLLPCPEEMNLVDRGICYVEIDNEHGCLTKAKITEPLVVIAIKKFFERIGIYSNIEEWVQDLLLNPLIGPQSRGLLFEMFVPGWVRKSFNMEPIDVSTHPLFRGIKDLPPWLQNCRLWPGNGKSINCASATGTGKYLTEPKHQFVFPDSNAGPDLIFYLEELDSPVRSEGVTNSLPIGEFLPQITGSQPPFATLQSTVDSTMSGICKQFGDAAVSVDIPLSENRIFDVPSSCIIKQDNTDALSVTANGCYNCDEDASELLQYGEVLPTCDTADMAGESNAVARLGQARGRLRLCLAQVKLSSDGKVSSNTAQHGKKTTDWRNLYDRTQKDGNPGIPNDRKDKAVAACKALQAEEGTLRILMCVPAIAKPQKGTLLKQDPIVSEVVGNDVFLVITLDNLAYFGADERDLNLIRMITDPEIREAVAVKEMRM
ncbi:PREDICTED: uncharacterized protein LOC106811907 isoform X2 [Priapulus caudatus]|uniref:Uncharacterized protein LOC106811907 isoform X2 n=1 Tax=Priapulus caudatus TaxID=37621 RepID=A0ABM1EG08_PRICU|nr:PREDICTED: uncharacterized protein LOC106811907 isoform X2 [Priapulus caudatus]